VRERVMRAAVVSLAPPGRASTEQAGQP
jgi:hypothetical protein